MINFKNNKTMDYSLISYWLKGVMIKKLYPKNRDIQECNTRRQKKEACREKAKPLGSQKWQLLNTKKMDQIKSTK